MYHSAYICPHCNTRLSEHAVRMYFLKQLLEDRVTSGRVTVSGICGTCGKEYHCQANLYLVVNQEYFFSTTGE